MKKRVALYVRVSTAEQKKHGLSVDSQIEALQEYAKENGLVVVGIYNDAGCSARKNYKQRPGLLQLIEDCNLHKIDMIIFTKLDRWFRSVKDYYTVMDQIGEIPWRAIWEDYETETSSGIFKVNIMLSVAQSEADRTAERIRSILEYKREKGDYVGTAPLGYKVVNNALVIDPETEHGVKAFIQGYLDCKPIKACIDMARANGVIIKRDHAYRILANTTYAGVTSSGYKCPAYIDMEDYKKICERKNNIIRTPALCRVYIFQGIVYCGYCGYRMKSSSRWRHTKKHGEYRQAVYQCQKILGNYQDKPCQGCAINENVLESILLDRLDDAIKKYVAEIDMSGATAVVEEANAKITRLKGKLKRIGERYEDGDITREEYVLKRDATQAEIASLQRIEVPHEAPTLPEGWREQYALLTPENKKAFWRKTVRKIIVYRNRQIEIEI